MLLVWFGNDDDCAIFPHYGDVSQKHVSIRGYCDDKTERGDDFL